MKYLFKTPKYINSFPNKPWFLHLCSTSLLKTLWEKEKLLVTSNFSFSHSVFCPFWRTFPPFSSNLKLSSGNSFSLEESEICRLGKGYSSTNPAWKTDFQNIFRRRWHASLNNFYKQFLQSAFRNRIWQFDDGHWNKIPFPVMADQCF